MLLERALLEGAIATIYFTILIYVILWVNPRFELHNYPKEIQKMVEPQTKKEKIGFLSMAIPGMLILIVYVVFSMKQDFTGEEATYIQIFLHALIIIGMISLFDLVVSDFLIFCTIQPKFMIIPGTENHPAYKDKMYHIKTISMSIFITIVGAAFIAVIVYLLV